MIRMSEKLTLATDTPDKKLDGMVAETNLIDMDYIIHPR